MKKITKNLLVLLTMVVLCFAVVMTVGAEGNVITGKCGDDAYWSFDESTGTVVISGTGEVSYDILESPDTLYYYEEEIKTLIIEEGITALTGDPFTVCNSLVELTLPESLKKIGHQAFMNSCYLEVYIPSGVEEIQDGAFFGVKRITVSENNKFYTNDDKGVLFNKDKTELIVLPACAEITEYNVPEGVVRIHNTAQYAQHLTKISFPTSLRVIDEGAFALAVKLEEVEFSEGIESIGKYAFANCLSLESITLPSTIKNIDNYAFGESYSLKKIIVKSSDVSLGEATIGLTSSGPKDISYAEWIDLGKEVVTSILDYDKTVAAQQKFDSHTEYYDEPRAVDGAVIYIHDDYMPNTVKDYAIEKGIKYEAVHFYGEWEYDWDKNIRTRKCELCDAYETEQLETTENGDVEIIKPVDPDTDFVVDVVTDYVIIEEALKNNVEGDFEVVKAFDITMTNKDGVHVQPDGTVKVKLPLGWSKDGVYKVYRVNDDGTLTDMQAYRQGSHMVFDTDHFSIYVIVDESEKTDTPVTPDEPQAEPKDDFFSKLFDLIKSFFDLILSMFK